MALSRVWVGRGGLCCCCFFFATSTSTRDLGGTVHGWSGLEADEEDRDVCLDWFFVMFSMLRHFGFLYVGVDAVIPRLPSRTYMLINAPLSRRWAGSHYVGAHILKRHSSTTNCM